MPCIKDQQLKVKRLVTAYVGSGARLPGYVLFNWCLLLLLLFIIFTIIILTKNGAPMVQKELHKIDKWINKILAKRLQLIKNN